jgi:uncharacterized protein (TIGR03086 family)
MSEAQMTARAAAAFAEVLRTVTPDRLEAPTPCADYDVRGLLNHLLFWGPCLEGAARKQSVPPAGPSEKDVDLTGTDWAASLQAQSDRLVAAWNPPGAWDGVTWMAGPTPMPAALVGGMLVGEFVVHGWDLARAVGRPFALDDDLLGYLRDEVAKIAEEGRAMGVFGPEVIVPATAPLLDQVLALTGRDPRWTP